LLVIEVAPIEDDVGLVRAAERRLALAHGEDIGLIARIVCDAKRPFEASSSRGWPWYVDLSILHEGTIQPRGRKLNTLEAASVSQCSRPG
jgi:hypothetical protein